MSGKTISKTEMREARMRALEGRQRGSPAHGAQASNTTATKSQSTTNEGEAAFLPWWYFNAATDPADALRHTHDFKDWQCLSHPVTNALNGALAGNKTLEPLSAEGFTYDLQLQTQTNEKTGFKRAICFLGQSASDLQVREWAVETERLQLEAAGRVTNSSPGFNFGGAGGAITLSPAQTPVDGYGSFPGGSGFSFGGGGPSPGGSGFSFGAGGGRPSPGGSGFSFGAGGGRPSAGGSGFSFGAGGGRPFPGGSGFSFGAGGGRPSPGGSGFGFGGGGFGFGGGRPRAITTEQVNASEAVLCNFQSATFSQSGTSSNQYIAPDSTMGVAISELFQSFGLRFEFEIESMWWQRQPQHEELYKIVKTQVARETGTENGNERLMFHGTALDVAKSIINSPIGFNRSFNEVGVHGRGVYFSRDLNYSHNYAKPAAGDQQGVRTMLLSRVVVGNATQGTQADVEAPQGFHSTCRRGDDTTNPVNVAVFRDGQALLEVAVRYRTSDP